MLKTIISTMAVVCVVLIMLAHDAQGQKSPMAIGTVVTEGLPFRCTGNSWGMPGMTCQVAQVTGCPNSETLGFTYAYKTQKGTPLGTIVLFSGAGGTAPSGSRQGSASGYTSEYFSRDYNVVQIAWDWDWERTNAPGHTTYAASILNAACRPATFLNFVQNNTLLNPRNLMCAQGASAGSGAVAYALVWYGADQYIRSAELLAGPVFGNIEQGCYVPPNPPPPGPEQICAKVRGQEQFGCNNQYGRTSEWNDMPQYIPGAVSSVRRWTNDSSCNAGRPTSSASNQNWLDMSIVNGKGGNFSFPNTSIAGWLCSTYRRGSCDPGSGCPNNSSAQGEYFYNVFTKADHPQPNYSVTGILECNGAEGLNDTGATTPDGTPTMTAVVNDMSLSCR
ncbi:MAG TPA: hypothetical protein VFA89_00210 [Terriglobales bacterium]|nr:hypothetical protein [Terriglobales bacterium]